MKTTILPALSALVETARQNAAGDTNEMCQYASWLRQEAAKGEESAYHRFLARNAREVIQMAEQHLAGRAARVAAQAERVNPGATQWLQGHWNALIAGARAEAEQTAAAYVAFLQQGTIK